MPHLSAILSLKIASRKFFFKVGGFDFVFSPEARIAPSENALPYDQLASGGIIYAYVNGNPVNATDPLGLCGPFTPLCAFVLENALAINTLGVGLSEAAAGTAIAAGTGVAARTIAAEVGAAQAFNSFRQAKSALSLPGTQIHHVVEQCQANVARSGFPISRLNSTDNFVRLTGDVHSEISAFYSTSVPGGGTFRDSLNGLPFEEQYSIGMDIVQRAINGSLR